MNPGLGNIRPLSWLENFQQQGISIKKILLLNSNQHKSKKLESWGIKLKIPMKSRFKKGSQQPTMGLFAKKPKKKRAPKRWSWINWPNKL